MIIKVKSPQKADGWFVFDNADDVFFSRCKKIRQFFADTMGGETVAYNILATTGEDPEKTSGSFFELREVEWPDDDGWHLTFCQGAKRTFEFFGDTEAYLLNDNGKTLERIF